MTDGAAMTSARPHRLKRRPDFLAAAGGRRFHTERMTAQGRLRGPDETRDGAPAEGLYLGFTVTKRVGHATERNRIRRRLRRAVEIAAEGAAPANADVVVIARRPALDAAFATLVDDLRRALGTVTRPRERRGDAAPGGSAGQHAHERRARRRADAPRTSPTPHAPHGSTDG